MKAAQRLHQALAWNERLGAQLEAGQGVAQRLPYLQQWQRHRLHLSYADLMAQERFQPACEFFLDELYGGKDFSQRHQDLARVEPIMSRIMPDHLLETVAEALEVQALSLELDLAVSGELLSETLSQEHYAQAYRRAGRRDQREQQLDMILRVGQALDAVVHKFWVYRLLRMLRGPALAAGFGELQHFLETGFAAFKQLDGAEDFLTTILQRERDAMEAIFAGNDQPFAHLDLS